MLSTASYIMLLVMFILSANHIIVPTGCYITAFAVIIVSLVINIIVKIGDEKYGL